ncbi:MAG: PH domain-containing protein [Planctomycetaceae bacterium]|nr:PH domain-containing protein [Planctomycetaceae bacterium]
MSDTTQNETPLNVEWSYSGKALRSQALLFVLLSLILVGGGLYASFFSDLFQYSYFWAWIGITSGLVLLWGYHFGVYFYRTYTIHYQLNERHLCSYRGLFTRVRDTQELVHIDDVRLVMTLFDRVFNGGVGKLVIFSATDRTGEKMVLTGIDNPKEIFEHINTARTTLRAKRSILTGGGGG